MIDLTDLHCAGATPHLLGWAALQEPALGGVTQRVGRLGTRFELDYETPPMRMESEGRRALALLQMAQLQGGWVLYPQPDLAIGSPGAPTVDGAHSGGMTLSITGATPRYAIRQGQALNLTVAGRRYLHFAAANALLDGAGAGEVPLTTPMRVHLAGGEAVELARPVIEGFLDGNERNWTIDLARTVGLKFTIRERA